MGSDQTQVTVWTFDWNYVAFFDVIEMQKVLNEELGISFWEGNMKKLVVLSFLIVLFTACGSNKALQSFRENLQRSVREYNDLVRQNEFDKAKFFVYESVRDEFGVRAKAAKSVKVTDYRVLSTDYETGKGEEIIEVHFNYYIPPSDTLKTVMDRQKWSFVYVKDEERKRWRLMTPLPEFK
jgi:hypothetical protein